MLAIVVSAAFLFPRYSVEPLVPLDVTKPSAVYSVSADGNWYGGVSYDDNGAEAVVWRNGEAPKIIANDYIVRKITNSGQMLLMNKARTKVAYYSNTLGLAQLEVGQDIQADMNQSGKVVVGSNHSDGTHYDFTWTEVGGTQKLLDGNFRAHCIGGTGIIGGRINWISSLLFTNNQVLFIYLYGTTDSKVLSISEHNYMTMTAVFGGVAHAFTYTSAGGASSYPMAFTHIYKWESTPQIVPVQINDSQIIIGKYGNDTQNVPFIRFPLNPAVEFNPRIVAEDKAWRATFLNGENETVIVGSAKKDGGVETAVVFHPTF